MSSERLKMNIFRSPNRTLTISFKNTKSLKKSKLDIPTLSPIIFRKKHIKNSLDDLLNDDSITQFFIHSFKEDNVNLNLPLPPHKKTVNDFVFITNGSMTRSLGIESFELKKKRFSIYTYE